MLFSKKFYLQGLKRIRVIGIVATITVVALNLFYAHFKLANYDCYCNHWIACGGIAPFTFLTAVFAFGMVASIFSFLNKRQDSDFYNFIPQKRICIYTSYIASVLTWIAGINCLTIVLNSILLSLSPTFHVPVIFASLAFLGYTLSAFTVASIVTICRMLSGTGISLFFYTISFLTVPRLLAGIFINHIRELNPSIVINETWLRVFSLENSLYFTLKEFGNENNCGSFENVWLIITLITESILFFGIGALLYKNLKSEFAGKNIGIKKVQLIFRTAITLPLIWTSMIYFITKSDEIIASVLLGLSLLLHFLFELILSKSAKKAVVGMVAFLIPLLISIGLFASSYGIAEGFRATSPKTDEINYITVEELRYRDRDNSVFVIDLCLNSETAKTTFLNALKGKSEKSISNSEFDSKLTVKFTLKNGKEQYREVYFSEDNMKSLRNEAQNVGESIPQRWWGTES